jgi:hypothetical protein
VGLQVGGVDDLVNAVSDPIWLQDVGSRQTALVSIVQRRAEVMQEAGEYRLGAGLLDAFSLADGGELFVTNVILGEGGESLFDGQPCLRDLFLQMGHTADGLGEGVA